MHVLGFSTTLTNNGIMNVLDGPSSLVVREKVHHVEGSNMSLGFNPHNGNIMFQGANAN